MLMQDHAVASVRGPRILGFEKGGKGVKEKVADRDSTSSDKDRNIYLSITVIK